MDRKTVKTATILITSGDRLHIYRSKDAVPLDLRKRMESSIAGGTAATVLIADQRGREEILRTLRGEETPLLGQISIQKVRSETQSLPPWLTSKWLRAAVAGLIPLGFGILFYLLLRHPR